MSLAEYLLEFAIIAAREDNISVSALATLAQINTEFYNHTAWRLKKLAAIYRAFAPRVAESYHRRLIGHPIKYTRTHTKVATIASMMNRQQGVQFLSTDPPVFNEQFLATNVPALVNVCLLLRLPAEFYYQFIWRDGVVLCTGKVTSEDIIDLGPRSREGYSRLIEKYGGGEEAEMSLPGRYFVDLKLPFVRNPITISDEMFISTGLYFNANDKIVWEDYGDRLQGRITPNVFFTANYISHMIMQFKSVDLIEIPLCGAYINRDPDQVEKSTFVKEIRTVQRRINAQRVQDHIRMLQHEYNPVEVTHDPNPTINNVFVSIDRILDILEETDYTRADILIGSDSSDESGESGDDPNDKSSSESAEDL